jgi:Tfp pilus assembly protein PilF
MHRRLFPVILLVSCCLLAACAPVQEKKTGPDVHYILGVSYLREGNSTKALQEFQKALENEPRNPDVHVGLGKTYHLKGALDEAEKHYLQALKLRPDDPLTENNLGALYLDMKKFDESIRYFGMAANNLTFTNAEVAFAGLGYAHFLKGEYLEAISAYEKALAQNDNYVQAHLRLGEVYYTLDRINRAIGEYRHALRIDGNFVPAHFQVGLAYMKLGEREKARQSFQYVLRLAPGSELAEQAESYLEVLE